MRSKQEAACQRERLLSFESVKRWMERETIRSNKTRIGYLDHLQVLLDRLGCNPDELVAQRIEEGDYLVLKFAGSCFSRLRKRAAKRTIAVYG